MSDPIKYPEIDAVNVSELEGGGEYYRVGYQDVTRIELCTKPGQYVDIPYVRVWKGDHLLSEHCQHNVIGVYFKQDESS